MTDAREDFETAVNLLADLLEDKLDGEVDFVGDFEPWTYLRETFPPIADRMERELISGIMEEFLKSDPNNASKMRSYLERLH